MKRLFFALALCAASGACMVGGDMRFYEARSDKIRFTGRAAENGDGSLSFDWSGCHFTFRFDGSRCAMRAADTGRNYYNVFVDRAPVRQGDRRGSLVVRAPRRRACAGAAYRDGAETHRSRAGAHDALRHRGRRCPARPAARPVAADRVHRRLAHVRLRYRGENRLGAFHPRDRELRPGMGLHRGALFRCRLRAHGPFGAGRCP